MLDLVPFLSAFSIQTGHGTNAALVAALAFGFLVLVGWHVWFAFENNSLYGFLAYTISRTMLCLLYVAYFAASNTDSDTTFHLHHYLIGFLCATFAEFNHPVSLVLLAAGSGIMVQGMIAYDADYMVDHNLCPHYKL